MRLTPFLITCLLLFSIFSAPCLEGAEKNGYHSPEDLEIIIEELAGEHEGIARLRVLGETPGKRRVLLLELGSENPGQRPAIFVIANMEGNCPLASEAAMELSKRLLGDWREELETYCWYIIPVGNPDGYASFFQSPLFPVFVNAKPFNDDNDDAIDEDGPEDLNDDGFITTMRQVHPEGKWMEVKGNPLLLKVADQGKGERGVFRLFSEGLDNDQDGEINEDGPGGVNPGWNFPHNFQHYTSTNGPWAASEMESRSILRFAFDHPEIALILVFGRANTLKTIPKGGETSKGKDRYRVPSSFARRLGIEAGKEFSMEELVSLARDAFGYMEVTEETVLRFLGEGAASALDRRDLPYWKELGKRYIEFLEEAGLESKRLDPPAPPSGSIEEWAYFQFGVPSVSLDFWTVPKKREEDKTLPPPGKIEKMSKEEFVELGEEKISALLEEAKVSNQFTLTKIMEGLESGAISTEKIARILRKGKEKKEASEPDKADDALFHWNKNAFLPWEKFDHPTLGEVEIGGKIPYADLAPPPEEVQGLLQKQLPFVQKVVAQLPSISVERVEVSRESEDVWRVEAWVKNRGFLPYPIHQGERCKRPTPIVVTVGGDSLVFLEGRERTVLGLLGGSGGVQKVSWLLRARNGTSIFISAASPSTGSDSKRMILKGGGKK